MNDTMTLAELAANPWASCGPAALASLLDLPLRDIRHAFPAQREDRTWTNLQQMQRAIAILRLEDTTEIGLGPDREPVEWPLRGLVIVQFRGSWDAMPISHPAQLQRSHWIAVKPHPRLGASVPIVFDINAIDDGPPMSIGWWQAVEAWDAIVRPQLAAAYGKKATGKWWTRAAVEVIP